jgi:hypothetical protein
MNKQDKESKQTKKPDENSGLHVDDHIKIFDPDTEEVFVNKRN